MGAIFKKISHAGMSVYCYTVPTGSRLRMSDAPEGVPEGHHILITKRSPTYYDKKVRWMLSVVDDGWEKNPTYNNPTNQYGSRTTLRDAKVAGQHLLLNVWGINTFPPTYQCRICRRERTGHGHVLSQGASTADATHDHALASGVCCDECNTKWVMPLRMRGLHL